MLVRDIVVKDSRADGASAVKRGQESAVADGSIGSVVVSAFGSAVYSIG